MPVPVNNMAYNACIITSNGFKDIQSAVRAIGLPIPIEPDMRRYVRRLIELSLELRLEDAGAGD
jgi:hypothetical protein